MCLVADVRSGTKLLRIHLIAILTLSSYFFYM
jgi:hypothetical protein